VNTDDLAAAFGKMGEDERTENFERSTLKLVLRRLGMPKQIVDNKDRSLAEGFSFSWFNDQGWLPYELQVTRCFSFDLAEVFKHPAKSALLQHLGTFWDESRLGSAGGVIFKAFGCGRLIVTLGVPFVLDARAYSTMHVPIKLTAEVGMFRIHQLDDFMDNHFDGEEITV